MRWPGAWVRELDLRTLERASRGYASDDLGNRADDIIWRVRFEPGSHGLCAAGDRAGAMAYRERAAPQRLAQGPRARTQFHRSRPPAAAPLRVDGASCRR